MEKIYLLHIFVETQTSLPITLPKLHFGKRIKSKCKLENFENMAEFIELATTDQRVVADMEAVTEAVKNPTAVRTEGLIVKEVDTAPLAVLMKKGTVEVKMEEKVEIEAEIATVLAAIIIAVAGGHDSPKIVA